MRKLLTFIIILLLASLLALWSPWLKIDVTLSDLFGVEEPERIAGLQVFSLSGTIDVYIDGEFIDSVDIDSSPLFVAPLEPGEKIVTLRRQATNVTAYWEFSKLITFEEGNDVIVSYNLGPEEEFSAGHVITARKIENPDEFLIPVNFTFNTDGVLIKIDGEEYNNSGKIFTQGLQSDRQHEVLVSKSGFEPLSFTLFPADVDLREDLQNYELFVDVQLMYQPLQIE